MRLWLPDPSLEPIPDRLLEPLTRCMHDMQQPRAVALQIGGYEGEGLLFRERDVQGGVAFTGSGHAHGESLVYELAFFLQDQLFSETLAAWGEARPACPGHAHPADAAIPEDDAFWICPDSGEVLAKIGSYGVAVTLPP